MRALGALHIGETKAAINKMCRLGINTLKYWEKPEEEICSLENSRLVRKAS